MEIDALVRQAAFMRLAALSARYGEEIPYAALREGFPFRTSRVHFMGPQGIFKPAILPRMPLSITTAPVRRGTPPRYRDELSPEGYLLYRYRGTDPSHPDNEGLRHCWRTGTPLIYFFGVSKGIYTARWPVRIVGDDPATLAFHVTFEESVAVAKGEALVAEGLRPLSKAYATAEVVVRMHQRRFRAMVLHAYGCLCAVCSLRHPELLDAAHILPDGHPRGLPTVPNGLSLCKLHHAAFDRNVLGIRPDLMVQIREDVLDEEDGPMLKHGLQGFHDRRIRVPRAKSLHPDPDNLEERFASFRSAG